MAKPPIRCEPCLDVGLVMGGEGLGSWAIGFCPECWGAATEEAYIDYHWPEGPERDAVLAFLRWQRGRG